VAYIKNHQFVLDDNYLVPPKFAKRINKSPKKLKQMTFVLVIKFQLVILLTSFLLKAGSAAPLSMGMRVIRPIGYKFPLDVRHF
jgi:hypothetical protein